MSIRDDLLGMIAFIEESEFDLGATGGWIGDESERRMNLDVESGRAAIRSAYRAAQRGLEKLDWGEDEDGDGIVDPSPLAHSSGWMLIDPDRVDENGDGLIDEGWSAVNGSLNAGDAMPTGLIRQARRAADGAEIQLAAGQETLLL